MVSCSESILVVGIIFSSVARALVNLGDDVAEHHIVGHIQGVLDTVLVPVAVSNLLEVLLRDRLLAVVIVLIILGTVAGRVDRLQELREERLDVEIHEVGRRARMERVRQGEFEVIIGRFRSSVVVELGDPASLLVDPVSGHPGGSIPVHLLDESPGAVFAFRSVDLADRSDGRFEDLVFSGRFVPALTSE